MTDPYTRETDVRVGDVRLSQRGIPFRVLWMNEAKTWCHVGRLDGSGKRDVETKVVEQRELIRRGIWED